MLPPPPPTDPDVPISGIRFLTRELRSWWHTAPTVTRWLGDVTPASSAIHCRFVPRFAGYKVPSRFPSMALSTRRPPSLHRVPASPVPRLPRYYAGATTSRSRIPGRSWCSLPGSMPPLVASCLAAALLADPRVPTRPGSLVNRSPDLRCLRRHGRIRDLIGSQAIRSVPLPRLLTPAGPVRPRLGGRPGAAPAHRATKAPALDDIVANLPRLQYPLPTLHECRCLTRARLASGWLARLCRERVQPSGSRPKVSAWLHRLPPLLSFLSRSACICGKILLAIVTLAAR